MGKLEDSAGSDDQSPSQDAVSPPDKRRPRQFGTLPSVVVSESFDDPLPPSEVALWGGV